MSEQSAANNPKIGFMVIKNERLSNLAGESIDLLYQPIVGVLATAVIRFLWRNSDNDDQSDPTSYHQHSHYELCSFLQIDFRQFKECRMKLEGAGLLRTFIQKTASQPVMIYQLVPPLANQQFFNDDLLSLALLDNVGEATYQQLASRLLIKPFPLAGAEEITQDFLDSFQIDADQITAQPKTIGKLKQEYLQPETTQSQSADEITTTDGFDFQLVLDCLTKSYVRVDQIKKHYQLILNTHRLYGIDEVELAKLIIRATNIQNNVFDPDKFKILVNRSYQSPHHEPVAKSSTQPESQTEFNAEERSLIKGAEYYAPIVFLTKLKQNRQGFASSSERRMVAELMERNIMTTGALNMLVYHVLVDRDNSQLPKTLFEYVANDWVQNYHVRSAVDAMRAIKAYNQKQTQKATGGDYHRGYQNQSPVKQYEPEWLQKDYQPDDQPVTKAERARMLAKLKDFNRHN